MLSKSSNYNENYLAQIVQLGDPVKHPKADRLQIFVVSGCRVITDLSYKKGDICVFFPLECKLNSELLSKLNMYEDKNLNADNTLRGYVGSKGRVRAVKLREEPSMGLILPYRAIYETLGNDGPHYLAKVGDEGDIWNGKVLCEKYIPPPPQKGWAGNPSGSSKNKVKRHSRLIEDQFRLHVDTTNLRKNMHMINPDDMISITYKLHGTSWVVGNVKVKRKLSLIDKVSRWFGAKVKEEEYDTIYSSRSVVKNKFVNDNPTHYYGTDLWGDIKDHLTGKIPSGFTLYGECVGWTANGGAIQKGYPYGYKPRERFFHEDFASEQDPTRLEQYTEGKHFGVYVYRITSTNINGDKIELSWAQVKEFCNHYGIKHVPELYYGYAKDWGTMIQGEHWHANTLAGFEELHIKQMSMCYMNDRKVPAEGIVVAVDDLYTPKKYKLKSFAFLEKESKELDTGEINIEDEQSRTE